MAEHAERILAAVRALPQRHPIVLIDGPSGAGKSTTADLLVRSWSGPAPVLVRMDDVYPGWHGLARAGEHIGKELLDRLAAGRPGRWQRHDWENGSGAERHIVAPGRSVVIEGCGVLTRHNAPLADLRVWIDGDPALRRTRALERDKGGFDNYWEIWEHQMDAFIAEHDPAGAADLRLRSR
ncbi:hypothetical protein SAMN04489806_3302 [Paramicrobacterium humi]|uniref:Uridine kinase n=2 Tax=Paramicrobacterium humi TaxID=640635 RepID=A0A1H4TSC4_9MICO|nr:hypothetical protein SAMN04489806_3302 [Microbacterium humi]